MLLMTTDLKLLQQANRAVLSCRRAFRSAATARGSGGLRAALSIHNPRLDHLPTTAALPFSDLSNLISRRRLGVELQGFVVPIELRGGFGRLIICATLASSIFAVARVLIVRFVAVL